MNYSQPKKLSTKTTNKVKEIVSYSARIIALMFASGALVQTFLASLGFDTSLIYIHSTFLQAANVLTILLFSGWAERGNPIKRAAFTALPMGACFLLYLPMAIMHNASILSYILLVVVGVGQQVSVGLFTVCQYKTPYYLFDSDEYGRVLSICGIISSLLSLAISSLITFLPSILPFISIAIGGFCVSALFMLVTFMVTFLQKPLIPIQDQQRKTKNKPSIALVSLLKKPIFNRLIPANFLRGFAAGVITVLATVAFDLGFNETVTTSMVTVGSIATLVACFAFAIFSTKIKPAILIVVGSLLVLPIPMMLIKSATSFLVLFALITVGRTIIDYAVPALLIKIVPVSIAGGFNAWRMALQNLGSLVATFIAAYVPTPVLLIVAAIGQLASGISFFIISKRSNERSKIINKSFKLEISEPYVVDQAEVGINKWGQYQFPHICKTANGEYLTHWDFGTDDIYYKATTMNAVSNDGKSWRKGTKNDKKIGFKMPNGNYFAGFKVVGTHKIDYYTKYEPIFESESGLKLFFADDIEEKDDKTVYGIEIDSKTGEEKTFECSINWPYAPLGMPKKDEVYPMTMVFALCNSELVEIDGALYLPLYTHGFNSNASSCKEAIPPYPNHAGVYLFKSTDGGLSWDYQSQILVDDSTFSDSQTFEGLDEPAIEKMPDGSLIMLIRTGFNNPSYIARSTDMGKTWSAPTQFDDIGVFPQIKTLGCRVTLATYGRPMLKIRATSDSSGQKWEKPIQIPLASESQHPYGMDVSCFYTGILPISDNEALLVYSDFKHPNPEGVPVKTILCRKITVVFDK